MKKAFQNVTLKTTKLSGSFGLSLKGNARLCTTAVFGGSGLGHVNCAGEYKKHTLKDYRLPNCDVDKGFTRLVWTRNSPNFYMGNFFAMLGSSLRA